MSLDRVETPAKTGLSFAEAATAQAARKDVPKGRLPVHRWYLRRPAGPVAPAAFGPEFQLMETPEPPVAYYRFLYGTVGRDWLWYERLYLAEQTLAARLALPQVSVTVLFKHGAPMGYFEIDSKAEPGGDVASIEYFGLMPWATGQRIGPRFLRAAIAAAGGAEREVTLNTCTLDHPAALQVYQAAGFEEERAVMFEDPDPRLDGLLPRDAGPHVPLAE